ncbi:MAG: TonB-dependent receptor [Kordiimonadaceae bacterium]|nr:TonB-dependent receptor [Kordiimonadaceae bacterium]
MTNFKKAIDVPYTASWWASTATVALLSSAILVSDVHAKDVTFDEIIVTAQRRAERLQDVPISMVALGMDQLSEAGVVTTRDLAMAVPGVIIANNGNSFVPTIRAISSRGVGPGDDPSVGTYIDGAYTPTLFTGFSRLLDVERIEVLKGPQGTLYGRNMTGGAVMIHTRAPSTDELTGKFSGEYGINFNTFRASAYLAGPLSDTVSFSIAASHSQQDDHLNNISPGASFSEFGNVKDQAARVKIQYNPQGSDTEIFLTVDWAKTYNEETYGLSPFPFGRSQFAPIPGVVVSHSKDDVSLSRLSWLDSDTFGITLNASFDLGDVMFTSITNFRSVDGRINTDLDRTSFPLGFTTGPAEWTNFGQELNLAGDFTEDLSWIAGVFIWRSDAFLRQLVAFGDDRSLTTEPYDPETAYGRAGADRQGDVDSQSEAAFAELRFEATDKLTLTGGIRFTTEVKDFTFENFLTDGSTVDEHSWDNFSYRVVGQYSLNDDAQVYASYTTGFKSGVYNATSEAVNLAHPEEIGALEIGLKAQITPKLGIAMAVFDYDYTDLQFSAWNVGPLGAALVLLNAADAKIRGAEINMTWSGAQLQLNGGLAWTPTAKYSSFPTALVYTDNIATGGNLATQEDISGSRMIQAPKVTANLGGSYTIPISKGNIEIGMQMAYNSGFFFGLAESAEEESYVRINSRITWALPDDAYRISLWATNLTDTRNTIYANQGAPHDVFAFDRGREVGIRLEAGF